jgi:hypothetical protein
MRGFTFLILCFFFLSAGNLTLNTDYRKGISNNVCKKLTDKVLVYCIFVDSQKTLPWSEFDMKSTIDSLELALKWIEEKASENDTPLNVIKDVYMGQNYATIKRELPAGNVQKSLTTPNVNKGIANINIWADHIAKRAGAAFNITGKDGIPEIKNPKNKERLIAFLRDEYQVDNVALLFMINNYYKNDISAAINTMNNEDVEFAIVSYKYPAVIANCILQLFGASELYKTGFRKNEKKISLAAEYFPNDIMQDPYGKNISQLKIGDFTRYMIGWSNDLDEEYHFLLNDKKSKF